MDRQVEKKKKSKNKRNCIYRTKWLKVARVKSILDCTCASSTSIEEVNRPEGAVMYEGQRHDAC